MACVTNRPPGHPPPGMPDYDDLCEDSYSVDYTYDELTDGLSTCSGSVNDLLDELNGEDEMRDSRDLDNLDLEDLTIPDIIKIPNINNNINKNNNMNNNKNSFISNVKVRGFSYLNGGTGPSSTVINGQSPGQGGQNGASNGVSNGVSNGGAGGWESAHTSNGEGGEGKNGTEARTEPGRIGDFMKKKEAERKKEEKTSGCVMSEFMSVRDSKFTSLGSSLVNAAPALTPRTTSMGDQQHLARISEHQQRQQQQKLEQQQQQQNELEQQQQQKKLEQQKQQLELHQQQQKLELQQQQQRVSQLSSTLNGNRRLSNSSSSSVQTFGKTSQERSSTAQWSSTDSVQQQQQEPAVVNTGVQQTWTPRNNPSPNPDKKEWRPLGFDSNSLKRNKRSISSDSGVSAPAPPESFAWKDSTLERQLKDLQNNKFSDAPPPRDGKDGGDKGLNRSLERWSNTPLPKAEDPDVTLLKKARQEKKVKRYLEDNFKNREGNYASETEYDSDIGGLSSKYTSLDRRREEERSSPPKSPPPFSKAESRFEREQRIKVGSLDSYTPGGLKEKSLSPPPAASSAQERYERERFRVQPGRIQDYAPGRCSLANQEVYKAGLDKSGCGITKYSSSHSFNPLLLSKSAANLSVQKEPASTGKTLQKTLKDGYESDSTLSYRKHCYTPTNSNPSPQAKALYTQVQQGGEVPLQGLRMQAPEKKAEGSIPSIQTFQVEPEVPPPSRPASATSSLRRDWGAAKREQQGETEVRERQKQQLEQFYSTLDRQKEHQLRVDQESRKHHDTLLPSQKSPVPLNRYEDEDVLGQAALFLNAGKKPEDCKMVARALFSFQAQNNRELSFKKGDIIYIKKQVDTNWYEGERNAMLGIFPTTYVDILPQDTLVSQVSTLSKKEKNYDGAAKAKFNFTAQTPMELSFLKGESVVLSRRIDRNWFEGRVGSRKGILPVAYVDILQEPGEGTLPPPTKPAAAPAAHSILKNGSLPQSSYQPQYEKPRSTLGSASPYSTLSRPGSSMSNGTGKPEPTPFRALYNYKPQNEDEVELHEGDIVYVMEKCDDGWFVGTSQRTGIFGTFPGNYVTQI